MKAPLARLRRIEGQLEDRGCRRCGHRVLIVCYPEDGEPPRSAGCPCGRQRVLLWQSQAPPELEEALDTALERSDDYSIPLPTRRP